MCSCPTNLTLAVIDEIGLPISFVFSSNSLIDCRSSSLALTLISWKFWVSIFFNTDADWVNDRSLVIIPKAEKTDGNGGTTNSDISNSSNNIGPIKGPHPPKAKRVKSLGSRPLSSIISFIDEAVFEIKTLIIEIEASAVSICRGVAILISIACFASESATSIFPPIKLDAVI